MKIFIDIETVRAYEKLENAPEQFRLAWTSFSAKKWEDQNSHDTFDEFGGIYPEFGKIVCISVKRDAGKVVSFYADDERDLLQRFYNALEKMESANGHFQFIGHRIKTFDVPWIAIRMVANKIPIPPSLQTYGLKPWELTRIVDTWEIWKLGIFQSVQSASLESICMTLGVPSPKDDISGADVGRVYWEEKELPRIVTYCEKDVERTGEVYSIMEAFIL